MAFNISYVFQAVDKFSGVNNKIRISVLNLKDSFAKLKEQLKKAGDAFQESYKKFKKLGDIGRELRNKITLPVLGASGLGVKVLSDYETALLGIAKTTDMTAGKALDAFGEKFADLSKKIPVSAVELMNLGQTAAQFGVRGEENILGFSETLAKLSKSTDIVGEEGAQNLARLINVTGGSTAEVGRFASAIVQLGNSTELTESSLLAFSTRMAAQNTTFKMTQNQALGLSAALLRVGAMPEMASSAVMRSLTRISLAIAEGKGDFVAFSKIAGMTGKQFKQSFEKDATGALLSVVKGMRKYRDSGKNLTALFDKLNIKETGELDTLGRMVAHYDNVVGKIEESTQAFKENIALNREFSTFANSIANRSIVMRNKFTDLLRVLTLQWKPQIKETIEGLGRFAQSITGFVKEHPKLTKFITSMLLIGAVVGPLLMVLRIILPLAAATKALGLAFSITPFGVFIAGITTLISLMVTFKDEIYQVLSALGLFEDEQFKYHSGFSVSPTVQDFETTKARLEGRDVNAMSSMPRLFGVDAGAQANLNKSISDINITLNDPAKAIANVTTVTRGANTGNLGLNMAGGAL